MLADRVRPAPPTTAQTRRRSLRFLLDHLAGLPGQTWQQRWDDSPFADGARRVAELDNGQQTVASLGLRVLLCLRVIRPTLPAMRANRLTGYADLFRQAQADASLDAYFAAVRQRPVVRSMHMAALFDVACALSIYGIPLAELTPQALLHYAWQCRRHGVTYKNRGSRDTFGGLLAWQVLYDMGHFPPGTPQSIRAAGQAGQRSVEQLVDRHGIANPAVRDLLVAYLRRRQPGVDYGTLRSLATRLAGTFWARIERSVPVRRICASRVTSTTSGRRSSASAGTDALAPTPPPYRLRWVASTWTCTPGRSLNPNGGGSASRLAPPTPPTLSAAAGANNVPGNARPTGPGHASRCCPASSPTCRTDTS